MGVLEVLGYVGAVTTPASAVLGYIQFARAARAKIVAKAKAIAAEKAKEKADADRDSKLDAVLSGIGQVAGLYNDVAGKVKSGEIEAEAGKIKEYLAGLLDAKLATAAPKKATDATAA